MTHFLVLSRVLCVHSEMRDFHSIYTKALELNTKENICQIKWSNLFILNLLGTVATSSTALFFSLWQSLNEIVWKRKRTLGTRLETVPTFLTAQSSYFSVAQHAQPSTYPFFPIIAINPKNGGRISYFVTRKACTAW